MNTATVTEQCIDWILNVWDELGEETTRREIVRDLTNIFKDEVNAAYFLDAWFKDHGKLLAIQIDSKRPSAAVMAYEEAVREWVKKQLEIIKQWDRF